MSRLPRTVPSGLAAFGLLLLFLLPGSCSRQDRSRTPKKVDPGTRESIRIRASDLIRKGDPRGAMELLLKHADLGDPDDAFLLGEAALRGGRYAEAERAYRKVLETRPDDLPASLRVARICFLEARYQEAKKQLDWILARSPDHKEARALRSRLRLRTGDLEGAASDSRYWTKLAPEDAEPLCILGMVRRQQGDPAGAVDLLQRAVVLDPRSLPARQELAKAYAENGQKTLAQESSREALRLEREERLASGKRLEATYYRVKALQDLERGDPAAAMKSYEEALAHDPQNQELLREAGETSLQAGDSTRALEYLDKAVLQAPSDAAARRIRGEILLARGDPERALKDLLEAARLDPGDPAAHRSLAKAYDELHRPEAARETALAAELERKASLPPPDLSP